MQEQFLSIEEFNDLLHKWNGHRVKITKHEMDDIDETFMDLETISYGKDNRRIDDYEPLHELQLNGDAEIETTENEFEPLPSPTYEIPLEDDSLYEKDGSQLIISTDRAVYKIEQV
ncbi:hypothetical protein ACFOGI_12730 [Virgibacillus xinjiangensis]|uniref:Uncharacterized protein n=1 Tax=Virgibacillus xinjiangensis TaxID=393090 RepID=A0ABV7CXI8_9BACI